MMKRLPFLLVLWIVSVASLQAREVDSTRLAAFATQFISNVQQATTVRTVKSVKVVNGKPNLAVVALSPSGWVLMATDDVAEPVLGYNLTGSFIVDSTRVNPGFTQLIRSYDKQVRLLKLNPDQPVNDKWTSSRVRLRSATPLPSVDPLIQVNWNQDAPFNQSCPVDANGPQGHVYVGCVAVAMAQAMTVYNYPAKGMGTASYVAYGYGAQEVNFDSYGNYNWLNMQGSTSNKDIADFLYHCAVSVNMSFGSDGSGAFLNTAASALKTYFGYSSSTVCINKSGGEGQWTALLNAELAAGRPLIYSGDAGNGQSGHAFNIDGYVQTDVSTMYHLNWGWSGLNNGYFSINVLKPGDGSNDFSKNNQVIVGLKPIQPGPIDLSLSRSKIDAGLPAGTTVGAIEVVDEMPGNTYTYSLSGTISPATHKERPLYFMEENGLLKTTKEFQYTQGGSNTQGVKIKVTDKFGTSISKEFYIEILPPNTTGIDRVEENDNLINLTYSAANRMLTWDKLNEPVQIAVYTAQGKIVSEQTISSNQLLMELPKGFYLVRLKAGKLTQTIKLISSSSL